MTTTTNMTARNGRMNPLALLAALGLVALVAYPAIAADAHAWNGGWFNRPSDSQNEGAWFASPVTAAAATITWTSGPNQADRSTFPHLPLTEAKFAAGPAGRAWTGFSYADGPGWPCGSFANTAGGGSSRVAAGRLPFRAAWSVTAGGTLGGPTPTDDPRYESIAGGDDPWPVRRSYLVDPMDTALDLFIPVGLTGGASTVGTNVSGGFSLSVRFETSSGTTHLLDIACSGEDAMVGCDRSGSIRYFLMNGEDDESLTAAPELTLTDIQDRLLADLVGDSRIDTPLYVGIFCDDFPISSRGVRGDDIGIVHVDLGVHEAATIPEPASLALVGFGGLAGLLSRRRIVR